MMTIKSTVAALVLGAMMILPSGQSRILHGNTIMAAGTCDCSKCRSDQVCCRTANGYCGCFPKAIKC
jgi:hypothetical protein